MHHVTLVIQYLKVIFFICLMLKFMNTCRNKVVSLLILITRAHIDQKGYFEDKEG